MHIYIYYTYYIHIYTLGTYTYTWGPAVPLASALLSATPLLLFSYIIRPNYSPSTFNDASYNTGTHIYMYIYIY